MIIRKLYCNIVTTKAYVPPLRRLAYILSKSVCAQYSSLYFQNKTVLWLSQTEARASGLYGSLLPMWGTRGLLQNILLYTSMCAYEFTTAHTHIKYPFIATKLSTQKK